jgi:hypothetical protein
VATEPAMNLRRSMIFIFASRWAACLWGPCETEA